ncbi:MAG TPA: ribosome biogenesis GTPase Der [Candidatus Hydrogenedentes bacterium]|nr:ribosome biogenesis GTPase Der [Candidatus Hydrogenedentota bacterium]HOL77701.1 ribosome biogenesis GTPase Der [Candidatus Hydrogenedentota bacterium]HPO86824.1 ribosome biogenesis GTPase Der [Candidatus Hydrogenedentota bacterium]
MNIADDHMKLPRIVICGRPNVGKSTLFNRMTGRFRAIVHEQEGVTRDRNYGKAIWDGVEMLIADTGGIVADPIDPITRKIQEQVRKALEEADVVLFVVDGRQELTRTDLDLCEQLRRLNKPIVLAVNKLDNEKQELLAADFFQLGLGNPIPVSATHGRNTDAVMEAIVSALHLTPRVCSNGNEVALPGTESTVTRVAIVGRPNVGKSSLVNALLDEERMIVTDIPGTTRDSVDVEFRWKDRCYLLVDTAGLRRKAGIRQEVERYSVSRTLRSIRESDVTVVLTDATEGITEQDKRIFEYIKEQGKAAVWAWSKWDLIENKKAHLAKIKEEIEYKAPFCSYFPMVTISSLTRLRLTALLDWVELVAQEATKRISTSELNRLMQDIRTSGAGSYHKGRVARILYATQASIKPTVFVLFVNQKRLFHFSYVRHIENRIRKEHGFVGVPIKIELREEKNDSATG